ncbi:enoyl-CoA hydratase/isomerase family protein [Desulfallas sp. Bu1-1]|uniref:enoyl-CoA hydratase/isomerase family protein n=1 Tax=Desulfallas sp. Bu1-1 TaxID=2787620 RepID=UPI00189CA1BF|nr:enoyl-CoA hydratase-related protein [Desulfallas sp. Bu1-1]MBF7083859.1 enoyl-CoA hydratase/isomerase family protein [Desulfallas sp. Bu1-1]
MDYRNILTEKKDSLFIITINRPETLNALNEDTVGELEHAFDQGSADPGVRVIIITGQGNKAFVAGADINEISTLPSVKAAQDKSTRGIDILFKIEHCDKPVIMAINGYALGGGCELAMAGDIRIASDNAKFGLPEINLGIIPGYGGTQRLPRLVGKGMAKMMIFSGMIIDAQRAFQIGLVEKVVPAGQLMEEAISLANLLAQKPPVALAMAKRSINDGLEVDLRRGCAMESSNFAVACSTEDRREGTRAFLEKRKPRFKGF